MSRRWSSLLVCLLVLAVPTVWLFVAQQRQPVDPTNRALKDPTSADAGNLRELAKLLPSENVVLLAFQVPGGLPILPVDRAAIADCRERIAALPGVIECTAPPAPDDSLALLAAALAGADLAATQRRVIDCAERIRPPSLRLLATGMPLYEARVAELIALERSTIVPIIGVCLFAASWLLYRRVGLAAAALVPAVLAIVWTSGIVATMGHALDPVAALLDPVLLTIGVASSVHFVESWRTGLAEGLDPVAAADRARRRQRAPLLLATGTTMVGLLSMATSRTPAVVDFGIRAAFGIALLHALLFVLLPRWLAVQRPLAIPTAGDAAGRWFHWLITRRTALSAGAVAVSVLAFAGLPRLAADNDPLDLLPPREPCLVAFDELAAHLGGVEVFHVLVPPESPATDLTRLLPFLGGLQTLPGIVGPAGPLLRGADGALAAPVLLAPGGSAEREQLFDGIERAASVLGLDGTAPVGSAVQIARDSQRLLAGLAGSTVLAIVLLGVGICIGLRSVRLGIVGIVPMVVACAWIYGAIAWLEHPVSVATAMIGCTMLGLIVDNALHLLHSYRHARSGLSPARAAVASLAAVGRPVWVSSFLLIVGFSAAATSRLSSTVEFALLACSTIAVAAFGCLVLLPLLLVAAPDRPGVADAV